jgi:hypothetical protein
MAEGLQSGASVETKTFAKGLMKDLDSAYQPDGVWSHARNAINNTNLGKVGVIGNEPGNILCSQAPYTIIGAINLRNDEWVIYSTDDTNCEIGFFKEDRCQYSKIVNDPCLGFKRTHLIIGIAKENFDCSWQVYWADGLNPDRTLNVGDINTAPYSDPWPGVPYVCRDTLNGPCENCEPVLPLQLDCERLRLAKVIKTPCVTIEKGPAGGTLQNGSYYAVIAYTVNQQKVTDYFNPSQVQALFEHDNLSGSLIVTVDNMETSVFDEFELVIVRTVNQQTSAKRIGYYNTTENQINISLDYINEALVTIPIENIPLRTPVYEKSEAIYRNGAYALRVAPTGKFDFNYQPLANQIDTEWVMVEQAPDYYRRGGNETGYMRDEQYAFWIRWIYNTGDKSSSYHIPGRAEEYGRELDPATGLEYTSYGQYGQDDVEFAQSQAEATTYVAPRVWEMLNTAYATSSNLPSSSANVIPGQVIARGKMGYWESSETYPADNHEVWDASAHPWSDTGNINHDLCGKPIRHHKMPADIIDITPVNPDGTSANYSRIRTNGNTPKAIRVLGVSFSNIRPPVDNDGNLIPGIVGYEILRSSREGNKTVIAKGIINNMRSYTSIDNEPIYYQNYPYNDLTPDASLTSVAWSDTNDSIGSVPWNDWNDSDNFLRSYSKQLFTFHSPDTQFRNPFLSAQELRLYGEVGGRNNVQGNFQEVDGHPKQKLPTNLTFFISLAVGIGLAGKAIHGKETKTIVAPKIFNAGVNSLLAPGSIVSTGNGAVTLVTSGANTAYQSAVTTILNVAAEAVGAPNATDALQTVYATTDGALTAGAGGIGGSPADTSIEKSDSDYMPPQLKIFGGIITYAQYMTQGTDATLDIITGFSKYRQYALSYVSHGDMHRHARGNARHSIGNSRRYIQNDSYLENQLQQFETNTINNAFRGRCVALDVHADIVNPYADTIGDNTAQTVGTARASGLLNNDVTASNLFDTDPRDKKVFDSFNTSAYSYYAGMKIRIRNQYGQLDSIRQLTTGCIIRINPDNTTLQSRFSTGNIFGGDIYIGRYTEKNTFFYFYDWLMNQPDGTEFDYRLRSMINNPRFWADFTKFDTNQFIQRVIATVVSLQFGQIAEALPSAMSNLDQAPGTNTIEGGDATALQAIAASLKFVKNNCWFYLFQSGVRDFFVESEINVDLRDYGTQPFEWHYDAYRMTDLQTLFAPDIIKSGNYFKYDLSLSVSRVFNNFISWGNMQSRIYSPAIAETCYTFYKNRAVYSLPQTQDAVRDAWQVYLANNYKDFPSRITSIKPIGKTGSLILFNDDSPVQFLSSESLELDLGTKITVGDGSLFSQAMQNLSNADPEFQHGSCQNRLSVINTPVGIYYMSQSQGKVFQVSGDGIQEISSAGMRWWFNKYLPYTLLADFPDFQIVDNPVVGIGCQATYDNTNIILYFCKKDYRLRDEFRGQVVYTPQKGELAFTVNGVYVIQLGDPIYFENTSWTISYDPKAEAWISFHDWHPELAIASKSYFLTTITGAQGNGQIWRHNSRTDLFANYYGQDQPFEIEFLANTGQQVNTLKSIEYQLECYTYKPNQADVYHVLDFNFDHAVISNTEQVSGQLNLNIMPKNNAPALVNYPIVNLNSIDILYSKVEQKYRFNQFWDITRDRGEYTYPGVQQSIWNTQYNGYARQLNANNLNYQKPAFQHKKFRHYVTNVLLYRNVSGPVKMLFRLANEKNLNSPR